MRFQGRLWLALPLGFLILTGCNKQRNAPASLTGKVVYNGKPVTGGMMSLFKENEGNYPVPIQPDGTFSVNQVPEGEVIVTVETESINPNKPTYGGAMGKGKDSTPEEAKGSQNQGAYVSIPRKYADPSASGIKITLTKGKNEKIIELKD